MDPISMDEFGPIAVDVFHGRRVEKVEAGQGGTGDPVWAIYFTSGGILYNYSPAIKAPEGIVGMKYTHTMLGTSDGTLLYFGNDAMNQVAIDPLNYAISDPHFTKGRIVFAQRSRAQMPPRVEG
jgi:hypothetical protein